MHVAGVSSCSDFRTFRIFSQKLFGIEQKRWRVIVEETVHGAKDFSRAIPRKFRGWSKYLQSLEIVAVITAATRRQGESKNERKTDADQSTNRNYC